MRMISVFTPRHLLAGLLVGCLSLPVLAQQNQQSDGARQRSSSQGDEQSQQSRDESQRSSSQRDEQRSQQRRQSQQQRQGERSQSQIRVQPEGWVRMGVDYDNDGSYDALETIYLYDLQMAQDRSRSRRSQQQSQRQDGQSRSQQAQRTSRQSSSTQTVSGQVQDVLKINLRDAEGKFVVARVRTNEGRTARVLLGKEDQLSQLDLQDGDKIRVQGRVGRVNDKPILVAKQVGSGDQTVQVEIKRSNKPLQQFRGEVVQTRTTRFRDHDGEYLIAQLQTQDGQQKTVNMGPKSKFSNADLKNAQEVCVLAATGKINGKKALIAEEVCVDGEAIKIKPDQRREQSWSSRSQGRSDSESSQSRSSNRR